MTTIGFEQVTVAGAVVRFWTATEEVVGGGFLVGSGLVATCAHVVADALGTDPYARVAPTARVLLDFPLLPDEKGNPFAAEAVVESWVPIAEDGSGDIALLRFAGAIPAAARMPPVRRVERLWDHTFWALGFPTADAGGTWTSGLIRGAQGTRWFQLQSTPGEPRIEGGFSGAPVWDAASEAVVGMTVAADRGDTTTAYLIPIDQVLGLDPDLLPNPYRGLEPFGEEHAATFFGRDAEIGRLLDALERLPVVAVAGPSGAGKSSLVRAGLVPRLRASGAEVLDVPIGADALLALDAALARAAGRGHVVLVVDQFEELAAADPTQARALLDRIVRATAPGGPSRSLRAVLTLRWAALDDLLTPTLIETLETGTVLVAPLPRARLRDAIVLPAERAPGLAFEAGLVDRILADAGTEPGQLPLVESLLSELWEHRDRGYLTVAAYEAAGGVAGAVAKHAEKVAGQVEAAVPDEDALRRLFTALARPDRDGRFVRRRVPLRDLAEAQLAMVPLLAEGRLLVISGDTVELAHQALIEHWPRLHEWLSADKAFLQWRSWLDTQRERWENEHRDDAALLRGATLDAAAEWLPARAADLPPAGIDYLRRSTDRRRRDVRRRRVVAAVLAVLVLVAATLSIVAVDRQRVLRAELATANANALGAEAQSQLSTEPVVGAQLALAAWRSDPRSPQARTALGNSYLALQSVEAVVPGLSETTISDMITAGDTVVLKHPAGLISVAGMAGPAPTTWQLPDSAKALSTDGSLSWHRAVSPDGRLLADVSANGSVRMRDLSTRGDPLALPGTGGGDAPAGSVAYPRFSPDGSRLAWAAATRGRLDVMIRDVRTGAVVPHAVGRIGEVFSTWFTPDPDRILIREGIAGKPATRLAVHSLRDGSVAPLPAGSEVARAGAATVTCEAGSGNGGKATVVVSPVGSAEPVRRITGVGSRCEDEHLSSDGGWLVENASPGEKDYNTTLRLTDLATGEVRQTVAPRFDERTVLGRNALSVAPALAVTTAAGRTSVLLAQGTSLQRLATQPGIVTTGERGASGLDATVAFTADEKGVTITERGTGRQLGALPGPGVNVAMIDSRTLWTVTPADGAWVFDKYEVPALRRVGGFRLPTVNPHVDDADKIARRIELAVERAEDGGRVLILDDGMLTVWDPAGAQQLGPPVRLATTPGSPEFQWTRLWPRPGHPGQVAALGADMSIQLWDTLGGRLLHTLPTKLATKIFGEPSQVAFDPSGARLAVLNANKTIEVWNAETGTPARPPIAAPDTEDLVGFDADGYLDVLDQVGLSISGLAFVDTENGLSAGSIAARGGILAMADDGRRVRGFSTRGVAPPEVPVIATVWHDTLCAASKRPFTPAELRLLPPGLDTDPPC